MCFGGGAVPQAPNTSAQSGASSGIGQMAQTAGQNQLNWANGQVQNNQNTTQGVQNQLTPLIAQQAGAGGAAATQFENQTLGGLNNQLSTAQQYGSPEGMAQAQGAAEAQVGQAYNAARLNNQRQLGSYGVDPSTMKSGALNLNANLAQAGAVGNAGYNAAQQRQLTGMGLTSQALGQNLQAAGVGQNYTSGANATGSNVVGLGNQTTATGSQALTAPSQMFGTGLSGFGQSANIQNQTYQNQLAQYNAQNAQGNALAGGLGNIIGMGAMGALSNPKNALSSLADGGAIPGRKRLDYGSPPVQASQGVPPQVGIPGPWIAANGGSPGPGMIQQGPSDGTGIDDQVPAKVSVGEYIVPADVVHAKGKEFFDKLLERYHIPAQQQRQQMGMH